MSAIKSKTAEALAPTLACFHSVNDRLLQAVQYFYTDASLDRLVLDFGAIWLVIEADENDDSVDLMIVQSGVLDAKSVSGNHLDVWKDCIGKPFGWGWITINQQGYCDGLLLSFGGIVPQVVVSVVASSIKVAMISPFA